MPIYKTKNGKGYRVEVNYTDSFGNRKKVVRQNKNTLSLKDAKQVEASILSEINEYTLENKDITLDQVHELYVASKKAESKMSSMGTKLKRYKNQISPYFGNKKVNKIRLIDFQHWKEEMMKKGYSLEYLNGIYSEFNAVLNYAMRYEIIKSNDLKKLGCFRKPDEPLKKYNVWTNEEFEKFIHVVRDKCEQHERERNPEYLVEWGYYVQYNILFYCGCRKGEVYPLQWSDVDFNKKMLKITKNLLYKIKKGTYIITTPKTKSSIRNIIMPMKLIDVLLEHKKRYENVYDFNDDFYICGGITPNTDTKLAKFKNECAREAGVKQITIHEFRHSHATILLKSKADKFAVSKRLGHSSLRETMETYAHVLEDTEYEVADLIDSL